MTATNNVVDVVKGALVVLSALFPIVNPLGNTPIFLSLTADYTSSEREALAWKIALNSFWLLTGSLLIGSHVLNFFGISVPVVQIGGGLVVMSTGWTLLQRDPGQARENMEKRVQLEDLVHSRLLPADAPAHRRTRIHLGCHYRGSGRNASPERPHSAASGIAGAVLVAITVYLCYRFAERLARFLGHTAMNVIVRLASFILLCIGVQILWNGVRALLNTHE